MTDSIMTPERLNEIERKQQLAADWQSVELDLNLSLVRNEIPELNAALRSSQARESALEKKAALFDFLFETCSYGYGNGSPSEPSPAEFGICWQWQQSTPEKPRLFDELARQAIEYYRRYVNEMDPDEAPTEWDRQVMEHLSALTPHDQRESR